MASSPTWFDSVPQIPRSNGSPRNNPFPRKLVRRRADAFGEANQRLPGRGLRGTTAADDDRTAAGRDHAHRGFHRRALRRPHRRWRRGDLGRLVLDRTELEVRGNAQDDGPPLGPGPVHGDRDVDAHVVERAHRLEARSGRHHQITLRHVLQVERVDGCGVTGDDQYRGSRPGHRRAAPRSCSRWRRASPSRHRARR